MNDFTDGAQIVVSRSALLNQLGSVVRAAMYTGGGWLVARGYLDDGLVQALVPLLLTGGALLWSLVFNARNTAVKVALADRLPDAVACAK